MWGVEQRQNVKENCSTPLYYNCNERLHNNIQSLIYGHFSMEIYIFTFVLLSQIDSVTQKISSKLKTNNLLKYQLWHKIQKNVKYPLKFEIVLQMAALVSSHLLPLFDHPLIMWRVNKKNDWLQMIIIYSWVCVLVINNQCWNLQKNNN